VKVLFVTDIHTSEAALKLVKSKGSGYDAVIVGGDMAQDTPSTQAFATRFLEAAFSACRNVLYVPGNADDPNLAPPAGTVPIHGKTASLGNYSVGGLGGSNITPFKTPFEMSDEDAEAILLNLGHVDILVSHCPPRGTRCDADSHAASGHTGSAPVRRYLEREKPLLVLSGHVHASRGVDNIHGTTVANPGPFKDGNYAEVALNGIISVELKKDEL
jgi:uncharacterized protein